MNIITTKNYVAGVFAEWGDAICYVAIRPASVVGFVHTNSDLRYPFYLLELADGGFVSYQTEIEARSQVSGCVLYHITEDFCPELKWSDEMGRLPHTHLDQTNCLD